MATKKKKAAKKKAANKDKELTDEEVFEIFGVGVGEVSLRKFISGQRKINGRLYKAIDLIGDGLKAARDGKGKRHDDCIDRACKINEGVPGEPPGCNQGGLPGGGG